MTERTSPERLPVWARVLDALAALACLLAAGIVLFGHLERTEIWGIRISMSHPGRAALVGAVLLLIRHVKDPRHPLARRLWARLMRPQATDERAVPPRPWGGVRECLIVMAGYTALVLLVTWPQARDLFAVPDFGDPLFNAWRLSWIAHQLPFDPTHLFDGNIFYPERLTLTYSDSVLVPGLAAAPLIWMGLPQMVATTVIFLAGWVFSGVTMYYLVRALTGARGAAAVAGTVFAVYPYHAEHYSHLEQQMAVFLPLTLLGLHRTLATGRVRDGLATGGAYVLQMYSCMYFALYLVVYAAPLAVVLWFARGRPMRPVVALAAGGLLAGVLIAPLAAQYLANQPVFGERPIEEVTYYSATPSDYLTPHPRSRLYGRFSAGGHAERQLFPGLVVLGLAVVALWPPIGAARLGYALAALVAFDASLGTNGVLYPLLRESSGAYRGLRVPARFSILIGLSLAVFAGYAVARAVARWPGRRAVLVGGAVALAAIDAWPRLELQPVWPEPPPIYGVLPPATPAVLAEFPTTQDDGRVLLGFRYIYFSTFHWRPLLNGNSGFFPPSWQEFIERTTDFPSRAALAYLRSRGVTHVVVHEGFYQAPAARDAVVEAVRRSDGLEPLASARFAGGQSVLYRLLP